MTTGNHHRTADVRLGAGGRAIQDVWEVPPAVVDDTGLAGRGFHGSTIRFFDSSIDAWRSTWVETVNTRVREFIGRCHRVNTGDQLGADEIVLLSVDESPHLRWTFRDITDTSFTWRGEASIDGGHTWFDEEHMLATRT